MTPGVWIARPGSEIRHLLGIHYSGARWKRPGREGYVVWLGACRHGEIEVVDDVACYPHVAEEDMHLYRPCKDCVMQLKRRVDHLSEILAVAWMDVRRAEPPELVG